VLALLVGGMLIHPLGLLLCKALGRPAKHSTANPLASLALATTVWLVLSLPLAWVVSLHRIDWFFPAMLCVIGGRYLCFHTLYGLRTYLFCGAVLAGAGFLLVRLDAGPTAGAFAGSAIEGGVRDGHPAQGAFRDLGRSRRFTVEVNRRTVEAGQRTQTGGIAARIQTDVVGRTVAVDHVARPGRRQQRCAVLVGKGVQPGNVPVGVGHCTRGRSQAPEQASGTRMPSCGRLIRIGARPRCRVKAPMLKMYASRPGSPTTKTPAGSPRTLRTDNHARAAITASAARCPDSKAPCTVAG